MLSSRLAPSCLRPLSGTLRLNARPKALSVQARYFAMQADYNPASISDYITKEHRDLEEAYNKILNDSDRDNQERWQNQFTWELARHSIAEELVIYPAFERHLSDGKDMAEHDRAEHQSVRYLPLRFLVFQLAIAIAWPSANTLQVKEHLYKFQGLHPTDSDFEPTLKTLWENLSHHIEEEESKDLPKLEKVCTVR
jgi:hypothetical protein